MPDLPDVRLKLAFTCVHENDVIPHRDPEADQLYKYARWLERNNILKKDPKIYPQVARLLRIATAYGHDKANLELREMIEKGKAPSAEPIKEVLDLTEELIKRGIPGGYYDMGHYLESGYGVGPDYHLAMQYYRKSADMGSPEGQYLVANKLEPVDMAPDIARQMRLCAAEQGHGEAAEELAVDYQDEHEFPNAVEVFQLGVKAGNSGSASFLESGFDGPPSSDELSYLDLKRDPERAHRYKIIGDVLFNYSYLHPKVPEIDKIVPLPPAKLPPWDGKLQWLEAYKANVPPPLPTEKRIEAMAKAKGLDPKTGRPLPPKR